MIESAWMTHGKRCRRAVGIALFACASVADAADAPWPIAGSMGLVRVVIVPADQARDRDAYNREIQKLCEPDRTCFLNFYTNTTGAAVSVPLPDAIDHEATAVFRRSTKQSAEFFQWSCRLKVSQDPCF